MLMRFSPRLMAALALAILLSATVYVYAAGEEAYVTSAATPQFSDGRYNLALSEDEDDNVYTIVGFGVMNPNFLIPPAQVVEANVILWRVSDGRYLGSRTINMQADGFFNNAEIYIVAPLNPADPDVYIDVDVFCSGWFYKSYDFLGRLVP